ncbi:calcium permease family membrane transporter [Histoplasma capsulatum G186AR]|uniref:Calcium permease family membrane transporter n=2 Tax=Ajellomyces capsulatus TaxID=5037 RepID=C0NYT3_AJECG|nr:calcium permease family membrane transporter [Histoplasma capsulatum G186AR]EEH03373.1 calcium permease family membrane transporter [Histoplasma capsulatum G186AR]KAG5295785.1 calcium permease family membrane transporter [Histoplasma capsulatum]QSS73766.1 calcium permease family membrane transporter [Histoplasma capsulatum G186AR]
MASTNNNKDSQDQSLSSSASKPAESNPIIETEQDAQASPGKRPGRPRPAQPQRRTTYGTMDSQDTGGRGSRTEGSSVTTYEPIRPAHISWRSSERTPKKPPTLRRTSTKPHRGQEFSVDDDPREYEEDNALYKHPSVRSTASLRRRGTHIQQPMLERVDSRDESANDDIPSAESSDRLGDGRGEPSGLSMGVDGDDDSRSDVSDAESFTLKDRQQAINETHPFGIRIWKPALYKKLRSVEKTAEGDIHSVPGERVSNWLYMANFLWSIIFGWWLALAALLGALACFLLGFSPDSMAYGRVFSHLSLYLLYPFGSFVRLESDENYALEDEGEGRSISEYEQWQSGDLEHGRLFFGPISDRSLVGRRRNSIDSASENDSLLGRTGRASREENSLRIKKRFFGRGEWTLGRVIFYTWFYFVIGPLMLLVSLVCWLMVFWIPMGRVTLILLHHLRRHPLALSFHSDTTYTRSPSRPSSSILLCTYRAAGLKYWKYTIDGTNIFLINLLAVVLFTILDYFVLNQMLNVKSWITHSGLIFSLALMSIIPLAYFIGQAVASISAQSSMGLGAAVNAFFSTVVEVYLYCIALTEGKARLVEGSIIGSIFAGILFLPGLSMCFGAIRRKTQRFNVKSAGVTSTMLLFSAIAAFGPTLLYQVYGTHELKCMSCTSSGLGGPKDCRRCYFSEKPELQDRFFLKAVQPISWFAALLLFLSYVIGLWFTLRTHAAIIWTSELDEKKPLHTPTHPHTSHLLPPDSDFSSGKAKQVTSANGPQHVSHGGTYQRSGSIRDSQLYTRILGQSLKHVGLSSKSNDGSLEQPSTPAENQNITPHLVPPKDHDTIAETLCLPGLSEEQNELFVRKVAEVAATAAAVAARDVTTRQKRPPIASHASEHPHNKPVGVSSTAHAEDGEEGGLLAETHVAEAGGHDAPNWSKMKSSVILLGATLLYAIIAEILVNTVDTVLNNFDIDEKFLGITLFALVPNSTEFLNAISFAINGNIALSMEIGSAYALQVCLLQIPALVLFSAIYTQFIDKKDLLEHSFNLIFPQWDMITVILCVFLLSYMYGEGKSNYFKGSILVLAYLFVIAGFYLSDFNDINAMDVDPADSLAMGQSAVFRTIGRTKGGEAYL